MHNRQKRKDDDTSNTSNKRYKKIKVEILDKYDKNKDNFITINEYLAEEISKGPRESSGNINYHYQNYINIYNFFTLLIINKIKAFEIMCIPKFEIIYNKKYIDRTTAIFDIYSNKYYFPESMIYAIKECIYNGIRLVYFTFVIKTTKSFFTHSNIVIIDLEKKTLERFEPYGCQSFYNQKIIDDFFKSFVLNFLQLNNYTYLKPENISKKIGIQSKVDAYGGMCVTISTMYLHMRVLNVNIKQQKIVDYFLKMSKNKLKNTILRYAKYIEKTLKKNHDFVNKMNYTLYNVIYHQLKDSNL